MYNKVDLEDSFSCSRTKTRSLSVTRRVLCGLIKTVLVFKRVNDKSINKALVGLPVVDFHIHFEAS